MNFEKLLETGVKKGIINDLQKTELLNIAISCCSIQPNNTSPAVKILYYLGGFIMICSMFAIMNYTINNSSYYTILVLGIAYEILFFKSGEFLWKRNEKFPADILYFLFICTFAFIVLAIEKMTGLFPHFADMHKYADYWGKCRLPIIILAVLTIMTNVKLQQYRRASLLAVPMLFCIFMLYMTVLHFFMGSELLQMKYFTNSSLLFSILLIIFAFIKKQKIADDYLKWMYFFGAAGAYCCMISFFCGYFKEYISLNAGIIQFQVFLLSLVYCIFGFVINRKPFILIGLLGAIEYIMYLEFHYIKDNILLLTSVILITGLAMLYTGVLFSKNSNKITAFLDKFRN